MDSYWVDVSSQHPCESTYEYFERYKRYLDVYPDHGFQSHELVTHFLDGMLNEECYTLYLMAGKHLMDCTPSMLWHLIEERAAATRPYMEYHSEQFQEETMELLSTLWQSVSELDKVVTELSKQQKEIAKDICELKSTPDPIEFLVSEAEAPLLVKDQNEEDIVDDDFGADEPTQLPLFDEPVLDEEDTLPVYDEPLYDEEEQLPLYDEEVTLLQVEENLQVVPVMSMEDVPAEEWISPPCSDIILEQNLVSTRDPIILPISKMFLSYSMQNGKSKAAWRENQVWGSLEKAEIHVPMVRTPMITLASEQVFDELCINWKIRKKSMGKVQNSVKRSNNHSGDFRPALAPMKLRLNWKKRKKGKCMISSAEFSLLSYDVQKNRASFGWKPGWISWKKASHEIATKSMRFWTVGGNSFHQHYRPNLTVRKFDGTHPWAPNL